MARANDDKTDRREPRPSAPEPDRRADGQAVSGRFRANAGRERIWFSPHCLIPAESASA